MVLEKCFTDEFISSRAGNNIDKKKIYEKVVYDGKATLKEIKDKYNL